MSPVTSLEFAVRESSFNMTRGGGGGLRKFLDTRKGGSEKLLGGGSENLYSSKPTGRGGRGGS